MTVTVPHQKTQLEAIGVVDQAASELFASIVSGPVQLVNQKKYWTGPSMEFSFQAQVGFISIPLSGTAVVDDLNVVIDCELPGLVKSFIGEDKIRHSLEHKVKRLLLT